VDKKSLIGISILVVVFLFLTSMNCIVTADQTRNHSVTIEITGQNTQQQNTINVSDTDLQKIKQVFADVSINLESATSPEDKLQVYWNAIYRLHALGVLGGFSCEEAYQLATRWYRPSTTLSKLHLLQDSNNTNALCLVAGRMNYSISSNRISNFMLGCSYYLFFSGIEMLLNLTNNSQLLLFILILALWLTPALVSGYLGGFLQFVVQRNPIAIGNLVGIGTYKNNTKAGWVKTTGYLGIKNWDGELYGALPGYLYLLPDIFYQAMWGFCGIKILYDNTWAGYDASYLGSALVVGINEIG